MTYRAIVVCSMHPEFPPGNEVVGTNLEDCLGYKWLTVKLANGLNRDVIVRDVQENSNV